MHKPAAKLMFGDFFLNFWLQRPNEDKEIENKTQNIRQLGHERFLPHNLTRRSSLHFVAGGGFNRAVRSPPGRIHVKVPMGGVDRKQ